MTLRKKTWFFGIVIIFILLVILYFVTQFILLDSFERLETNTARRNTYRMYDVFSENFESMVNSSGDWGKWDDVYKFLEKPNQSFIDINLTNEALISLKLNLILLINLKGKIDASKGMNLETNKEESFNTLINKHFYPGSELIKHKNIENIKRGFIIDGDNIWYVVSRPVLTSLAKGPSTGTLVMAKIISDAENKKIEKSLGFSMTIRNYDDKKLPEDFTIASKFLTIEPIPFINPSNDLLLYGYGLIKNIYDQPAIIVRIDYPREIMHQGNLAINYLSISVITLSLIFFLVAILFVEKIILSRQLKLHKEIAAIGESGDFEKRVIVSGKDEFSDLAKAVNNMLESLERSEANLKGSEELFRNLVVSLGEGVSIIDVEADTIIYANPSSEKIFGVETGTLVGRNLNDFFIKKETELLTKGTKDNVSGQRKNYEACLLRPNGEKRTLLITASPRYNQSKKSLEVITIFFDITDRKVSEEALADSEVKYRTLIETAEESILLINADQYAIIEANKKAEDLFQIPQKEMIGRKCWEIIPDNEFYRKLLSESLDKGRSHAENLFVQSGEGQKIPVEVNTNVIELKGNKIVQVIFRDINEKLKLQNELQKIQRIESISQFARGIAHNFNNLLAGIIGNLSIIKIYGKSNQKIIERVEKAETAALRAKDLTIELTTFARGETTAKQIGSIKDLLKEVISIILTGSDINCKFNISDDLWHIEYNQTLMKQVINNIILNAKEAMPEGGGVIEVDAENIFIDKINALQMSSGNYIKISVKDSGCGIPKENLKRIFDPFFSTKFQGRGIGLSAVHAIVRTHYGFIDVVSHLNQGSTFIIYFPSAEKSDSSTPLSVNKTKTDSV